MIYKYINNQSDRTIILLHGTGGDENSLLKIGAFIDPNANLLGIRGNVSENGLNRYFKRFGMGVYDIPNYISETKNLRDTILLLSSEFEFDLNKATIIGFSNGANIALGLLTDFSDTLNNYILLSSDLINKDSNFVDLSNKNVFLTYSYNDPYVNEDSINMLYNRLINANANLTTLEISGHVIDNEVISGVMKFYNNIYKK
jgi:phospholipase/carboxylesterase